MTTTSDRPATVVRTQLPVRDDDAPPPQPRYSLGRATPEERFALLGTWVAALALAWLVLRSR